MKKAPPTHTLAQRTRPVESDYRAALADVIGLDDWRAIVGKAVELAKEGDAQARQWITLQVVGREPITLYNVARAQVARITPEVEIEAEIHEAGKPRPVNLGGVFEQDATPQDVALALGAAQKAR